MSKIVKGLALSGGGAKGAWGAGVLKCLYDNDPTDYKILGGTSTGSLLMCLVALHKHDTLKEAYTSVNNDDIYKISPFTIKRYKDGTAKASINYINLFYNTIIRGQNTFGDSSDLRNKIIPKFFKEEDYNQIIENKINLFASVTNLTTGDLEYKSVLEPSMTYEDFLDWVYASACAVPFLSIVKKNNMEYADGGYREHIPIQEVINRGANQIDAIELKPYNSPMVIYTSKNPLTVIKRITECMQAEVTLNDFMISRLIAKDSDIVLRTYYTPRILTPESLSFDKQEMINWWDEAYAFTQKNLYKEISISKSGKHKILKDFHETA